ncbi:EF-P beta-lysylation protein EpmB [Thorsellia anophelis]|nr:EF-P beta-lysylation protein EpmB [Thorsellia anophelis]
MTQVEKTSIHNWVLDLKQVITNPYDLLKRLEIPLSEKLEADIQARKQFALRVPIAYLSRIEKNNLNDPLFLQVWTDAKELIDVPGFTLDPLEEQDSVAPGLLHKYPSRVLMILKGSCAINCRYCFRRHFPYDANPGNKKTWQLAIDYIKNTPKIDEVILSGGDPLMAKDSELAWLFEKINQIPHVRTIRLHSRLAVVIPSRITDTLLDIFRDSNKKIVLVTHINHSNEIDEIVMDKMYRLKQVNVLLLNQSVLLKDVNNSSSAIIQLSHKLFEAGILPYYLHLLDKVQGAAHFYVSDDSAKLIMKEVISELSGYLVPKLTREIAGQKSKTPIHYYD